MVCRHSAVSVAVLVLLSCSCCTHAQSIDGGRSELPGMKQDMFDQLGRNKGKPGPTKTGKGPPECPRSDGLSAFPGLAFVGSELFVKLNSSEEKCQRLISIGGANASELKNASRTCGPAGEWKKRIAENMSSIFFQGGFDWVRSENETLEVVTEEGTFEIEVNEAKYMEMLSCWKYACECEQAKNPMGRAIFMSLLAIAVTGLGYDSFKLLWGKIVGEKPSKHVLSKSGHRMVEVTGKSVKNHYCDMCGAAGAGYTCSGGTNYDLCKKCYKEAKKKAKTAWKEWVEKHPEDAVKKDDKDEADDGDEDTMKAESSDAPEQQSNKGDEDSKSEAESTTAKSGAEADEEEEEPKKE